MKPLLLTIFSILLITCCGHIHDMKDFYYKGDFYPSFMEKCVVTICKNDTASFVKLTIWDYPRESYEFNNTIIRKFHIDTNKREIPKIILSEDSFFLEETEIKLFYNNLDTISILNILPNENFGLDGITVDNQIQIGNQKASYRFWSPDKSDKEHKLIEAIFALCRIKFKDKKYQEYFESLEGYFDFGLPCKIISTDPLEVRIYGTLSSNEKNELIPFINQIPSEKRMIIDMTNFKSMGTMYYTDFKNLYNRNRKIIWVAKDKAEFDAIGIDTNLVLTDIELARQRLR
jgi:hypothetical protein